MLTRRLILSLARSPALRRFVRRYGMRLGAARFVAGETLDECVAVLRRLNAAGLMTNTTLLGEEVHDAATARQVTDTYLVVLDRIAQENLITNLAVKLSHLGLALGEEEAYRNVRRLAEHAVRRGNFVRMDMEDSAKVDATLRIYRRLRAEEFTNVGAVLQSYLYRTEADLEALLPLRPNLRLVKGAYLEPPDVAFPRKTDVDRNFIRLMERMLPEAGYTAIATHDDRIIARAIAFITERRIPGDRFEFQMLYGVRPTLQLDLVRRGFRVRVATPYGPDWYPYLMRRLAERPANVLFMLRNLLRR
ncbi:MAG: proline dehydrogenase family protein [Armatimonadota bacterium]|nr:proline dehydrogenase family protein [Armatimonadota bacterium]MDR7450789.1 proline dehydrogenase family protein [Armatimonadota bacterium]MDR7466145.1 proline dehydrogenase family protein [Armatimonadota bacterium]MDR7493818.1 proline dehydrogenase family protein [Armatimonadota bacterium]MDR7499021.1 proline dehydrogenase family protein [Armatimonadota bacterium]